MSNETRSLMLRTGEGLRLEFDSVKLLVEAGPDEGRELHLAERAVMIGRAEDMDLRLADNAASRAHATVEPSGTGWKLRDLGSKSGTFLDGVKVNDAPLASGSRIRIGATELVFRVDRTSLSSTQEEATEFEGILGQSPAMRDLFGLLRRLASLDLPVLIHGESGTGKEAIARALHSCSTRADGPYEVVDCTLLERDHMRSELFGHVKGAFTGADRDRDGAFVQADGGTLFLDEIAELPVELQPQFLRALEQGDVRPLGGDRSRQVRVRLVSATNRDLEEAVREKAFREDLFYRLTAVTVTVPPLRDRGDDALLLARHFLPEGLELDAEAQVTVKTYPWPGNVRELKFKMQRAAGMARGPRVTVEDMGLDMGIRPAPPPPSTNQEEVRADAETAEPRGALADLEERAIRQALAMFDGNKSLVAEHLGIGRTTLYRRLRQFGIEA
jgi:DNA-binding NtrC family response regulator